MELNQVFVVSSQTQMVLGRCQDQKKLTHGVITIQNRGRGLFLPKANVVYVDSYKEATKLKNFHSFVN